MSGGDFKGDGGTLVGDAERRLTLISLRIFFCGLLGMTGIDWDLGYSLALSTLLRNILKKIVLALLYFLENVGEARHPHLYLIAGTAILVMLLFSWLLHDADHSC